MTDLAARLAERVIDRRGSFVSRSVLRMLCWFAVDIAIEGAGGDATLEDAEDVLDEALRALKPKDAR